MKHSKFWIHAVALFLGIQSGLWGLEGRASSTRALGYLPVQDGGRIKPFETFARESLLLVYGKEKFEGKPAREIIMTWLLEPGAWEKKSIFEINDRLVKQGLKLDLNKKYFTPEEILKSDRISLVMQELASKRDQKAKLDTYFQSLQRLESQIYTLRAIAAGNLLRILPQQSSDQWTSVAELEGEALNRFLDIPKAFANVLASAFVPQRTEEAKLSGESEISLAQAVQNFTDFARTEAAKSQKEYAHEFQIKTEIHYNEFHPFGWAWKLYLIAVICIALIWITKSSRGLYFSAWVASGMGLLFHVYGFALRVYLAGRPPVSNMYETVVWVGFGAVIFAMVFEAIYRWRFVLLSGSLLGMFCLILADKAPGVLDPSLQPLEAVLRSNFWLTTHVMTIVISYSAFFLSAMVSLFGLVHAARVGKIDDEQIRATSLASYRGIQVGVALLAPGIILGGIWADYSWGRFWGWDPKETWALIALLGYLALLHARLGAYVRHLGFLAWSVIASCLVVMAWYGVNFILGEGKHSYGFGAGGVEYVVSTMIVMILLVVFTFTLAKSKAKS